MSMWSTAGSDYGMTSMEADPDLQQSTTACCPRVTIPDSCSCSDGCECTCQDCDCDAWCVDCGGSHCDGDCQISNDPKAAS